MYETDVQVAADLVTETDKAVEEMVSSTLRDKYPDFKYVNLISCNSSNIYFKRLRLPR